MISVLQAFGAGYAVCRAIDYSFDRNWKMTLVALATTFIMLGAALHGATP